LAVTAFGFFTVTVTFLEVNFHLDVSGALIVIVTVPAFLPVTMPVELTTAMVGSLDSYLSGRRGLSLC
jgi:hypothetical protein